MVGHHGIASFGSQVKVELIFGLRSKLMIQNTLANRLRKGPLDCCWNPVRLARNECQ